MKHCGGCPDCGYVSCRCDEPIQLLIGNTLSGCMRELLSGLVDLKQVVCIISGTSLKTASDFEAWADYESKISLRNFTRESIDTMLKALKPRLVQPRLFGMDTNRAGFAIWTPAPMREQQ